MIQNKIIFQIYPKFFNHCTILTVFFIIFIISSSGNAWGANIYIDPTYNGTELGTYEKPYNSWSDIGSFSASDDYRQKCGTTETVSQRTITVDGSSGDHVIIGAYYDSGGAVHEDDNPTFGQLCGNSNQKPILKRTNVGSLPPPDNIFQSTDMNYVEFNSLQLKDASEAIEIHGSNNYVRYCYIYHVRRGVRIGLLADADDNTVEYNYIDLDDDVDEDGTAVDAISLHGYAQNNLIQFNHITGFDHGGIFFSNGDYNIAQYNYIFEKNGHEDACFMHNGNGLRNIIRFNFCNNAGQGHEVMGGSSNEIYGNTYLCKGSGDKPSAYQGCFQIQSHDGYNSNNNKIYNNTIYDGQRDDHISGIKLVTTKGHNSNISGNEINNNIILKMDYWCISVNDNNGQIGSNYFSNNACYEYGPNNYASIEGVTYSNASAFNDRPDAANNRNDDPGLENPAAGQFWPESQSANVVGKGKYLGLNYNKILDYANTDFKGSPPKVKTEIQPVDWYIGAYALGVRKKMNPPPQEVSGFHVISKKIMYSYFDENCLNFIF